MMVMKMKMKSFLPFLLLLIICLGSDVHAQTSSNTARRIIKGASLPTTCTIGDVFFKTSATVGSYQCLTTNNWTLFASGGGGAGDVVGPVSSTDNAIVRYDGTTGKLLQNSVVTIDDTTGAITGLKDKGGQVFNVKAYGAVGDGSTDDLVAINAAVAAAASSKGTVYLPPVPAPGKYAISDAVAVPSNVNVKGGGREGSVLHALASFPGSTGLITVLNASNVSIEDLGFTSAATIGQLPGAISIIGSTHIRVLRIHKAAANFNWTVFIGSTPNGSSDILVDDAIADGSGAFENIAIVDSSHVRIKNCYLKQTTAVNGIELFLATSGDTRGTVITGNVFEGGINGVHDAGSLETVIAVNTFFGQTQTAVRLEAQPIPPTDDLTSASITGNTILASSASDSGILLSTGTKNCTVSGNTVSQSAAKGIAVTGLGHTISGNTVRNSAGIGIYSTATFSTFGNNTVINNSRGIDIEGSNCTIVGNVATDTRVTKLQDFGILIASGVTDTAIGVNKLGGNQSAPISDGGTNTFKLDPSSVIHIPLDGVVGNVAYGWDGGDGLYRPFGPQGVGMAVNSKLQQLWFENNHRLGKDVLFGFTSTTDPSTSGLDTYWSRAGSGSMGLTGSLVISGTSITTPSTTFALVNATATTVNFAGAATTLNIGAAATTILNFGGSTTAAEFRFLEPSGSGTNYSAFKAVAQGANITYSLPPVVGAAGTVLTDVAGDGVLTWAAGGGSGGITIGTTTITGGADTKSLFNNAGVVGERTVTGTGNAVLSTSPVFTTQITAPLVLSGSTSSGGKLQLNTTTDSTKGFVAIDGTTAGVGLASTNNPAFFANSVPVFAIRGVTNTSLRNDGYHGFSQGGAEDSPDATLSRSGAGVIQFGSTSANAAGSWLATNGTLSGALINTGITADTAHTDTSVCQDTTSHQFYSGTGTLGVCLGTSTLRAKRNVVALGLGLSELMRLKPISFSYREGWGYDPDKTYYGFGAEDVRPVLPNLAPLNLAGQPSSVDMMGMVPLLVRSIQEQQAEIENLRLRIRRLEAQH